MLPPLYLYLCIGNAQNITETILKGAREETTPEKNKNTLRFKCVRVVMCYVQTPPRKIMWGCS